MKNIFILAFCVFLFACKKDSDNDTSKKDLLIASAWLYNNGGIADPNGNILVDFSTLNIIPACALDNTIVFATDGSGTGNDNALVCTGTNPVTPFNWNFLSNETILNITGAAVFGISGEFKIRELTTTKLSLGKDTTITGFGNVSMVFNLKH
jgi:hypothetical protein